MISQIHGPAPPPLGTVASRRSRHSTPPLHPRALLNLQSHDSLWERYHWGVQEFQSGVDRIVRNGETIVCGSHSITTSNFTTDLPAGPRTSTREALRLRPPNRTARAQISDSCGRIVGKPGHLGSPSIESPQPSVTLEIFGRLVESLGGISD